MPQPKKGARLGSNPSHQGQMLSNLALSLFEHERIKTTEAKAKLLRPFAEHLITKAKDGSVHQRRNVLSVIENRAVVHKLFADIAPRFADRNGGYTRILKIGPRSGDGAPMAVIELVEGEATVPVEETGGRTRGRRLTRSGRRRGNLPQDKPVRSKGEDAAAAGAGIGIEHPEEEPAGPEGAEPESPEETPSERSVAENDTHGSLDDEPATGPVAQTTDADEAPPSEPAEPKPEAKPEEPPSEPSVPENETHGSLDEER